MFIWKQVSWHGRKLNAGDAHLAVYYERLLKEGLKEYEKRTLEAKEALDLCDPASISKYHFYDAVLIVIDAVKSFAKRYADLAREQAKTANEERRQELLEIARICSKVPYEPAESFYEPFRQFG